MIQFKEHKSMDCDIVGCHEEASYWLPIESGQVPFLKQVEGEKFELPVKINVGNDKTCYLCTNHADVLSESVFEEGYLLDPALGYRGKGVVKVEMGVYSCHEDCPECNR